MLPADWRVMGFAVLLTLGVAFLFGLVPALRASSVKPVSALEGGGDPHARRRLMNVLVAAQVAFCFLVHFVAGLFVATFDRLSHQPTGFNAERVLVLETSAKAPIPCRTQMTSRPRSRHPCGIIHPASPGSISPKLGRLPCPAGGTAPGVPPFSATARARAASVVPIVGSVSIDLDTAAIPMGLARTSVSNVVPHLDTAPPPTGVARTFSESSVPAKAVAGVISGVAVPILDIARFAMPK